MLYTTRAIADALNVRITVVRNDVARGVLRVERTDPRLGNRYTHEEAVGYYKYRRTLNIKPIPPLLTYFRVLRRCTAYHLTRVYGLHKAARALGMTRDALAHNNRNYRKVIQGRRAGAISIEAAQAETIREEA